MFEKKETKAGRAPDFQNGQFGISVWTNQDKNGNPYLSIKIPALGVDEHVFPTFKKEEKKEVEKNGVKELSKGN
jgi:uncharacterized protein (DUF736 family)